ncbi:MAG TPA: alginate export family protein [Spirochaetota bacterium]|nr:alginate export family protein [Spirochaetota bacterium]
MKLLKVLFVAAMVVAIAAPTFAAVQNIKVSGSIEERAIFMNNFDLRNKSIESTNQRWPALAAAGIDGLGGSGDSINSDSDSFVLSTIKVGIDSDLTDNVSASIVLANQSRWGGDFGTGWDTDVVVNKAFVTLREFFYQPLTLKIGRQDIAFGDGFIIGPGIFRDTTGAFPNPRTDANPDRFLVGTGLSNNYATPISGAKGLQYSVSTYYDAARATLDLDPWTIDVIYSKITDSSLDFANNSNDPEELAGVNAAYKFDNYDSKVEAYYFYKNDDSLNSDLGYTDSVDYFAWNGIYDNTVNGAGNRVYDRSEVNVFGMRGDIDPVENLTLSGEGAVQWGKLIDETGVGTVNSAGNATGDLERKRLAWAIDVSGDYLWKDVSYKPNLGLGFTYLSGEENANNGKFNGWDPMYKGSFNSLIRDYMAGTGAAWNNVGGNIYQTLDPKDPSGSTNNMTLYVDGGLKPMEDLTLKARYLHFWVAEKVEGRAKSLGNEVDASLVYDYTEDVQFDLTGGIFMPGNFFKDNTDAATKSTDNAVIVTGGVKVAF